MRKIKYLLSNLNLMNIMLAVVLVFLVNYTALPFLKMNTGFTLPSVKRPVVEKTSKDEKGEEKSPSPSDYMVIAEHNLFHPDRIIPVPKVEAPPLPQPDFVLYGTLKTDGLQIAYMDDKKTKGPQDKDKRQTVLRLGESMSGFILKEIEKDQVVMQRGEQTIVVSLNETKSREATAVTPPPAAPAAVAPTKAPAAQTSKTTAAPRRERIKKPEPGKMVFGAGGGPSSRRPIPPWKDPGTKRD